MAWHGDSKIGRCGRRLGVLSVVLAWTLVQAVPAGARPGFGVKGGDGGGSRGSSTSSSGSARGSSSSPSSTGTARSGSSGSSSRGSGIGDTGRPPGFGRNPSYRDDGLSRGGRSRDRFFDRRGNDGGYGYRDRVRYRDRRDSFFYSPLYYYGTPYYSPFGYGWPYDSVFGYYDWYTSPERRYDDGRDREYDEDRASTRQRGNVQLDIQPRDVEVRIDGVLTTRDGRAALDLPEGNYRLEIARRGYRPWATELMVRQGIRYRVEQRLERARDEENGSPRGERDAVPRLVGELLLDVTPDDAIVTLDGRLLGVVNLLRGGTALRSIPVGIHTLTLSRPGYRPVTREITVDAGEPLRLKVSMERE